MERFRNILRAALTQQARRVRLSVGQIPELTFDAGRVTQLAEFQPYDQGSVDQLMVFLFPKLAEQRSSGGPLTGTLQVPQIGALKLLAQLDAPSSIRIYGPGGEAIYESDLTKLQSPTSVAPPAPVAQSPAPANAPPAAISGSDDMVNMFSSPAKKLPMAPASMGKKLPAPSFVIPEGPASASSMNEIPQVTQIRDVSQRPSHAKDAAALAAAEAVREKSVGVPPAVEDVPLTFKPAPLVIDDPSLSENSSPFEIPPLAGPGSPSLPPPVFDNPPPNLVQRAPAAAPVFQTPPVFHAPPSHGVSSHSALATPAADTGPVRISFANDSESEGSVGDGSNPIDMYLTEMVQKKASDMHLTIGQPVIMRIHGEIERTEEKIITAQQMESFILPTMPGRNKAEFAKINDTDFAYELKGVGRFRVNVFRDRHGVGAVLRHIPAQILTAEQLKLPPAIMNFCHLSKGLVLVTGPTGSGKSTTLAAMIDSINKKRKEHILTVEDPIEFVHPQQVCLVNQREIHKHTGSFARALKAALREDPDIVLIGEMRDLETIAIAIETAETGHLVFGTLHTTTAMSTVDRIIDQFPADRQSQIRTMLASSLRGVVTQTLLKKKGGGRVAAHEILVVNDAVSSMIREGKIHMMANHMMTQKADGNQLLNDCLFKLIADGLVTPEDAFFKAVDKNDFINTAKRKNIVIAA